MKLVQYPAKAGPVLNLQTGVKAAVSQDDVLLLFQKQTQYQGRAFVPVVILAPTVPVVEVPDWNLSASKDRSYITTGLLPLLTNWNERTTPDKYVPLTEQPYFATKHWEYQYPYFFFQIVSFSERSTPDKWQPLTNQPYFPQTHREFQYLFLSQSLPVIAQAPDIQQSGMWQTYVPFFPLKHPEHTYPSFFTDAKALTQKERITSDKWQPNIEQPFFPTKHTEYQYQTLSQTLPVIEEPAEIQDAALWQTQVPFFPIKHNEFTYPTFFTDPNALTQKERTTPDKWQPNTEQPYFPTKHYEFDYPSLSQSLPVIEEPAEIQDAALWQTQQPYIPAKHQEYIYPTLSEYPLPILPAPVTTNISQDDVLLTFFKQTQYQSRAFVALTAIVPPAPQVPQPQTPPYQGTAHQEYTYPTLTQNILPIEETSDIQLAGIRQTDIPFFAQKHWEFDFQTNAFNPNPFPKPNTVDQWFKNTEQPYFPIPHREYFYPSAHLNLGHYPQVWTTPTKDTSIWVDLNKSSDPTYGTQAKSAAPTWGTPAKSTAAWNTPAKDSSNWDTQRKTNY